MEREVVWKVYIFSFDSTCGFPSIHTYWLHSAKYFMDLFSKPDLFSWNWQTASTRSRQKDHFPRCSCLKHKNQIWNPTGCLRSSRASWRKIGNPQSTTALSSWNSVSPFPMKKFICLKQLQKQSDHRMVVQSGVGWGIMGGGIVGFSYQEEI